MDWWGVGGYGVTTSFTPSGSNASIAMILITNSCSTGWGMYTWLSTGTPILKI